MLRSVLALAFLLCSTAFANPADDLIAINSGSTTTVSGFQADAEFNGGSTYMSMAPVNTANVSDPAAPLVYQSNRYGNFSYVITGFQPGSKLLVRLHFAEPYWNAPGARIFNVYAGGSSVPALNNFDIFAAAGGQNIAVVREIQVDANSLGNVVLQFSSVVDNALVSGIEVRLASPVPPQPTPGYNLTLGADKASYAAGDKATIVVSLQNTPDNANYEFFVRTSLNGNELPLTKITDTHYYAITPVLAAGQNQVVANLYLQNKLEAKALQDAIDFYASEISRLTIKLGQTTDPNQIGAINAEIAVDQNRLDSTKDHLNQVRTPVGAPIGLNLTAQ